MLHAATDTFVYQQILVAITCAVSLLGTWIGMRHFARARATKGSTHRGWLLMASVGTGATLWASTFISILALDPLVASGFEPMATGAALLVAVVACLVGFEIGSRHFRLAPEAGGLAMGAGILAMYVIALNAWHIGGHFGWNAGGTALTVVLGLGLSVLAVNRAGRPVTRWCRHGAALAFAVMICAMHYSLAAAISAVPDASVTLPPSLLPANWLAVAVIGAVLLIMGNGLSTYVIDQRQRTEAAERIHQLSFNDTMTGLPNRIAFNERLAFDSAEAHEKAERLAAFSIDLDGFNDINHLHGQGTGDLLLIDVADRMRKRLAPGEFLARQGGDEFLALKMSRKHPHDAYAFAERISRAFAEPFTVQGYPVHLTASIGFSVFPTDTPERDQLLSNAKLAMQRGKSRQSGSISMYSPEMDDSARKRRALARDLEHAAARHELLLNYQLQMSLNDGRICGAEALMRWQHSKLGMVSPAEFIPLAEETEAIIDMGEWALRAACRDAAEGKIPGNVAVNLSPVQFGREDLAEMIHGILLETGLSPERLEVEVTESTIMSDQNRGLHILRKLKAMGISVAMDDFGTGYSSLATLHAFPFDKIKLDQTFVKRLPHDTSAAAIVRTVLALGESLHMPVLAEGIETEAQWEFLAREGCAKGQGFLFARPVAVPQLPGAIEAAARFARDEAEASDAEEPHGTVAA
jgi:diguanylate cyclase (GGDEF)-like protein